MGPGLDPDSVLTILGGAVALARSIEGLLYGVAPRDPVTIGSVVLMMGAIGVAAAWVPAVRASRIAPSEALRSQ